MFLRFGVLRWCRFLTLGVFDYVPNYFEVLHFEIFSVLKSIEIIRGFTTFTNSIINTKFGVLLIRSFTTMGFCDSAIIMMIV